MDTQPPAPWKTPCAVPPPTPLRGSENPDIGSKPAVQPIAGKRLHHDRTDCARPRWPEAAHSPLFPEEDTAKKAPRPTSSTGKSRHRPQNREPASGPCATSTAQMVQTLPWRPEFVDTLQDHARHRPDRATRDTAESASRTRPDVHALREPEPAPWSSLRCRPSKGSQDPKPSIARH